MSRSLLAELKYCSPAVHMDIPSVGRGVVGDSAAAAGTAAEAESGEGGDGESGAAAGEGIS